MAASKVFPSRGWWAVLVIILFVAGALRFTGYNFSLPYIDHVDEAAYNLAARMVIDSGSPKPLGMHGYPPGIIAVNYFFLRQFQDPAEPPGTILWMVRLVSVTFSLATIVALALLGYRAGTPLAGLIVAGLWTITPVIVEHSRYATADNFVTFFSVLALFLVLTGTRFNRSRWVYAAIVSQMLAILFKYQAVFLLPVIFIIPLWRLTDRSIARRGVLREFAVTVGMLGLFFFWLIFLFPALEATSSPDWSAPSSKLGIPTPANVVSNFQMLLSWLDNGVIGWLGLIALAWRGFRRQIDLFALVMVAGAALAWVVGMSFYGAMGMQQFRQFISAGAFLYVLRAVGLVGWVFIIDWALGYVIRAPQRRLAAIALVVLVTVVLALPSIQGSIANAENHTLPDRRNDLAHWMDVSLTAGAYIAGTENHKTLNRDWGGYAGETAFPFVETTELDARPIEEWRAENVRYAIIGNYEYERLQSTAEGQAELAQTLLLKTYPPSQAYRGPDMVVLRLYPIENSAEGQLGSIRLVGYDLNTDEPETGEMLTFTLYWQADTPTEGDYAVFNHLINTETGELVAQVDSNPLVGTRRPTNTWDDPTETLVSQPFTLALTDVPPGTYALITGFYNRESGARLRTADGEDRLTISAIHVR